MTYQMNEGKHLPEVHRNRYRHKYQDTSRRLTGFWTLMSHWKGSVIKLIYHNLIIFVFCYFLVSFLYRYVFIYNPRQRDVFELMCIYSARFQSYIPTTFLIGFYVQQVVSRWWSTFTSLPFPDKVALKLISFIPGKDPFRTNLRRTVMRYINLSTLLVYRLVSTKVKKRFPTLDSLVVAKLLLPHEADRLEKIDFRTPHEATWAPVLWALKLISTARVEAKIVIEAPVYANLVTSFEYIEDCNRKILNYGWIEFPLAYTQVATFSVYAYFLAAIFGRQFLAPRGDNDDSSMFPNATSIPFSAAGPFTKHTPDFYVPIFTFVEFICYLGWIKVAETLLNPFGDDDEDFEVNYLIDRNLQVSYLIVAEADQDMDLAEDPFLEAGITVPDELPYLSEESIWKNSSPRSVKSMKPINKNHSVSLTSVHRIREVFGVGSHGSPVMQRTEGQGCNYGSGGLSRNDKKHHSERLRGDSECNESSQLPPVFFRQNSEGSKGALHGIRGSRVRQDSPISTGKPKVIKNGFMTPSPTISPSMSRRKRLSCVGEVDHEYDLTIQKTDEGRERLPIGSETFSGEKKGLDNVAYYVTENELAAMREETMDEQLDESDEPAVVTTPRAM